MDYLRTAVNNIVSDFKNGADASAEEIIGRLSNALAASTSNPIVETEKFAGELKAGDRFYNDVGQVKTVDIVQTFDENTVHLYCNDDSILSRGNGARLKMVL